jgi:hypothetical protein
MESCRGAGVTPANANGSADTSATTARLTRAERETERLRAENARLNAKLAQTQAALSIMGKAHELLPSLAESTDTPPSSSYNPGWILAAAEDGILACDFIDEAITRNRQVPHTVHADRGTSMTSQPVSRCWPTSASPEPIPGPGHRTTIRFPKRSSKP